MDLDRDSEGREIRLVLKRLWGSIDRDLYDSRPLSMIFVLPPLFLPVLAEKLDAPSLVIAALSWIGWSLAGAWMAYVIWRMFKRIGRDFKNSFADIAARGVGADVPIRCPVCDETLPEFFRPDDGVVYRFRGWTCANCGAQVDADGCQI